mgnify:FL=1
MLKQQVELYPLFLQRPLTRWVGVALFSTAIWLAARSTNGFTNGPILCPFRRLTGHVCPFCGTSRSIGALMNGDLAASLAFNPLGLMLTSVLLFWTASPSVFSKTTSKIAIVWWRLNQIQRWLLLIVMTIGLWSYAISRW